MTRVLALGLIPLLAGCVPDNRSPAISSVPPPSDPNPTKIVLSLSKMPVDSDANGYPDTLSVRIHLFEAEGGWPLSVAVPGSFRFELAPPRAPAFATWNFDAAQTEAARGRDGAGPCYAFELSLLSEGRTDRVDVESVDLRAVFTPAKHPDRPIRAPISMPFGRTR